MLSSRFDLLERVINAPAFQFDEYCSDNFRMRDREEVVAPHAVRYQATINGDLLNLFAAWVVKDKFPPVLGYYHAAMINEFAAHNN